MEKTTPEAFIERARNAGIKVVEMTSEFGDHSHPGVNIWKAPGIAATDTVWFGPERAVWGPNFEHYVQLDLVTPDELLALVWRTL